MFAQLSLAVLLYASYVSASSDETVADILEPRLGIHGVLLHQLEKRIISLKKEIYDYRHGRTVDDIYRDIDDRIYHVGENFCEEKQFGCESNQAKCISELLVCDGQNDCEDGSDEDEDMICDDSSLLPGTVFTGYARLHRCVAFTPHDFRTKMTITSVLRPNAFTSRLLVKAAVTNFYNVDKVIEEHKFTVKGFYNFAQLNLVTVVDEAYSEKDEGFISICHIHNSGNPVTANCTLVQQASLAVCGRMNLIREGVRPAYATAVCHVDKNSGIGNVEGTVKLRQKIGERTTTFDIDLRGFSRGGLHGFHVHEKGDLSDKCSAAGGHYNPLKKQHGAPSDKERHVGDLGNLLVSPSNDVKMTISDHQISLLGERSVIGKAIVIHADVDDLGLGGVPASKLTGNAGGRLGCCIIEEM